MKRALVAIGCGLALLPASAAGSMSRAPSPRAATTAFGRLLHQLYGENRGYRTCLSPPINGRVDCLAEVHGGRQWHQISLSARIRNGVIVFTTTTNIAAQSWVRQWSPYSRHYILRSRESAPGVVSVNGPAYDWGWLANCSAGVRAGQTHKCDAYDGNDTGLTRFYIFTCARSGRVVTCKNALGDAMRWRRRAP